MEFESCNKQHTLLRGDKVIIGADRKVHSLVDNKTVPLLEGSELKGFDKHGIAEYICMELINEYKLDILLDTSEKSITNVIDHALEKIL